MPADSALTACPAVLSFADPLPPGEPYRPPAERILGGDPLQSARNVFASADGRFNCGIWDCAPGKWRVVFTESEFCHLVRGAIVVIGDDGSRRTFRAGDAFVSPAGFTGIWEVLEPTTKLYAIYE